MSAGHFIRNSYPRKVSLGWTEAKRSGRMRDGEKLEDIVFGPYLPSTATCRMTTRVYHVRLGSSDDEPGTMYRVRIHGVVDDWAKFKLSHQPYSTPKGDYDDYPFDYTFDPLPKGQYTFKAEQFNSPNVVAKYNECV